MKRPYELPSMRAITALGLGATVAVLSATLLMHLVQTVLHFGCEFLVGGAAGDGSLFVVAAALQPRLIPILAVASAFGVAATRPMTMPGYVLTQ